MKVEQKPDFYDYTADMKVAFYGDGYDNEFATSYLDQDIDNESHQIVSEAKINKDRKFGYAIVRGLQSDYSFDMIDDETGKIDDSFGDVEDISKEVMATAIMYDKE